MTEILKDNLENLLIAANLLNDGKIVVFPTETVYGIGADIFNENALKRIFEIKKRDFSKALTVHISKIEDVQRVAIDIPDDFYKLAQAFFPGPLTLILKKRCEVSPYVSNTDTVAVRMPNFKSALFLISNLKNPIVGSSANISCEKSLISAFDIYEVFKDKVDLIIDGGVSPIQIPSTVLDISKKPYRVLRKGSISLEEISEVLEDSLIF